MQKLLYLYENKKVRTINENGDIWFVARDVCAILGLTNARQALVDNCEEAGIRKTDIRSGGQTRKILMINEANLYNLTFGSKKKAAKAFRFWISREVIPAIRKTGSYSLPVNEDTTILNAIDILQKRVSAANDRINELAPQVEQFENIHNSNPDKLLSIGEFSKLLGIEGLGPNNLFKALRSIGVLLPNNQPYQDYIKWFNVKIVEKNGREYSQTNLRYTHVPNICRKLYREGIIEYIPIEVNTDSAGNLISTTRIARVEEDDQLEMSLE